MAESESCYDIRNVEQSVGLVSANETTLATVLRDVAENFEEFGSQDVAIWRDDRLVGAVRRDSSGNPSAVRFEEDAEPPTVRRLEPPAGLSAHERRVWIFRRDCEKDEARRAEQEEQSRAMSSRPQESMPRRPL